MTALETIQWTLKYQMKLTLFLYIVCVNNEHIGYNRGINYCEQYYYHAYFYHCYLLSCNTTYFCVNYPLDSRAVLQTFL